MGETDLAARIDDANARALARLRELIREHKRADADRICEIASADPEYQRLATKIAALERLRGSCMEQWLND